MTYIVCGWYTPDYKKWADKLISNLETLNIPYDIVETPRIHNNWETSTLAKPKHILNAMDNYPNKIIVFLDADCKVNAQLGDLVRNVSGDIAFYVRVKRRRNGMVKWGNMRSGTMVIRPTAAARLFIKQWIEETKNARYGDTDQDSLMLAFSRSLWITFNTLPVEYCALVGDKCSKPIIYHSSASATNPNRMGKWQKMLFRYGRK